MELARLGGNADTIYIATLDSARLQRARGNWQAAQELLEQAKIPGLLYWIVQIQDLSAWAFKNLGRMAEALRQLKSALVLAEQEGYIEIFLIEGPPMLKLLRLAQKREPVLGFASRLIAAFAGLDSERALVQAPVQNILSQRQLRRLSDVD